MQPDLAGVERQGQFLLEERPDGRNETAQALFRVAHYVEVVDIPSVVAALQRPLAVLVQYIEVDGAEELAGDVPDGQSAAASGVEEALVFGKALPVIGRALDAAALCGVVVDRFPQQVVDRRPFGPAVGSGLPDGPEDDAVEYVLVDGHEVSLEVEFQHPAFACVVA